MLSVDAGIQWVVDRFYLGEDNLRILVVAPNRQWLRNEIVPPLRRALEAQGYKTTYPSGSKTLTTNRGNSIMLLGTNENIELRGTSFHYAWGAGYDDWEYRVSTYHMIEHATLLGPAPQVLITP